MRPASLCILALTLLPLSAHAHAWHQGYGFTDGLIHPLNGAEHFLAMLSIGLLSAQIGGRAIWLVPTLFVIVIGIGGMTASLLIEEAKINYWLYVPIQFSVILSVILLGLVIFRHTLFPRWLIYTMAGLFAFCHGYIHGNGIPMAVSFMEYAAGFMTATAGIHLFGVIVGLEAVRTPARLLALRYTGLIIALIGLTIGYLQRDALKTFYLELTAPPARVYNTPDSTTP
ncbi:MAG: HupE/UreJ family protein [Rickettsiales bacterium]|nr:HupE/UreJ family protein [Rickettsiales bacterium]